MTKHILELKDAVPVDNDDPAAIVTKALEGFQTAFDDRDAKLTDRLNKLEAKMNRPHQNSGAIISDRDGLEKKAFESFLRRGPDGLGDIEKKTLGLTGNNALTPPEFGAEVLKLLRLFSPIRQYARVVTVGATQVQYPRRTGSTAATWVSDTADRTESETAYEGVNITPFEAATYTDVSNQLLEDNFYNLEGELASDTAESYGIAATAFVKGNGTTQPAGLMTASGISQVITGAAAAFPTTSPADVLIGMFHTIPTLWAQRGVWLMNRNTIATIRQFKDGMGRYLLIDNLNGDAVPTLLGRPIVEAPDMDNIGANAFPILFGDLQGYRIVDRVSFQVLRDPYTMAAKGQTRFHSRKRVGGSITNPDRFVKLKVSAT
jgi:HK97 family phage major capsid protein